MVQFEDCYRGKKVFLTGHTGFKGSWLALWLRELGAEVCGYSLPPPTTANHFDTLNLNIRSIIADIRDRDRLRKEMANFSPDIVFHLAAQPLVRLSYREPIETFETNIIGSMNVYEAIRNCNSVKALVSITTDKVYHNKEQQEGYSEDDPLGGKDPYSASKAAMEILSASYLHSFFNPNSDTSCLMSTVRAGNVIGGGDWAEDRLIPDIIRATIKNESVEIRSPNSIRPWQHVLEPLSGYLLVGQKLLEKDKNFSTPYNFGPNSTCELKVVEVLQLIKKNWDKVNFEINEPKEKLHEAGLLKLKIDKAKSELNWFPIWNVSEAINITTNWYKDFYESNKISSIDNLNQYISCAAENGACWLK